MHYLNEIELRRYKKQISAPNIGIEGQKKLKNSKVLLIGAGSIGTSTLQYLAAAGVGVIGICDYKTIQEENFVNQIMYGLGDLGKLKTIVAKEKLQLLNPYVSIQIHNIQIKDENAEKICRDYDIIIDTTNQPQLTSLLLKNTPQPLLAGFLTSVEGLIFSFNKIRNFSASTIIEKKSNFPPLGALSGTLGCLVAYFTLNLIIQSASYSDVSLCFNFYNFSCEFKQLEL